MRATMTQKTTATATSTSQKTTSNNMKVSVSDSAVEMNSKSQLTTLATSPSSQSENDGMCLVFEDSDSELSSTMMDIDPWMEQVPSKEDDDDRVLDEEASMDSTMQELSLGKLKHQQEPRRYKSDGVVYNSYTMYTQEEMGRSASLTGVSSHEHAPVSSPKISTTPFRQVRRATAFASIRPIGIADSGPSLETIPAASSGEDEENDSISGSFRRQVYQRRGTSAAAVKSVRDVSEAMSLEEIAKQASLELEAEEEEQDMGPSFSEFALLSWSSNKLSLLSDESMFVDDGPRQLDAFCLDEVDFLDIYPEEDSHDTINPKALSRFCFPDGLRVRIIPRVAMPGAMRMKWAGVGADSCHILVFTDGYGRTQHGVAITVRQEVPLTIAEREQLRKIVRVRRRRRMAASRLCRWWRLLAQNKMLKTALQISNLEQHTIDELRAELSASELKLLQENVRDASRNNNNNGKSSSHSRKLSNQWQTKGSGVMKKMMKSPHKLMSSSRDVTSSSPNASVGSHKSHAEVESLTKNAIKRSNVSTASDNDCASEITDDTEPSDTSGDNSEGNKKRGPLMRKLSERMALKTPPVSPRQHQRSNSAAASQMPSVTLEPPVKKEVSEWARQKGRESYEAMKHATKHGNAFIMEQCYVVIGCRPDEHALLLGPLQQLVNAERKEINECRLNSQGLLIDEYVEKERSLLEAQRANRHFTIEAMLDKLRLTQGQASITFPRNHLDYIVGGKHYFQTTLPIPGAGPIKLPLPLPSVGKQWGLSRLLMDIGPDSLVLMLKLLLMERSILVLGENLQEVTASACSLLELLEPFEWSSVFLPVLPHKMLDFVTSPVPFVAGMAVNDYARVCDVEKDPRTLDAMDHGMSLLNLSTKTLHITSEAGISKMLSLDPYLREQLRCIRGRLQHLAKNPSSSLHSFQRFIRRGFSSKESVTLDSACMALESYFSQFCGDLANDCTAWKQYGTIHVETGKFSFQPDWFLNRIRADQVFHETMVKTQMFQGYVDERRRDQLEVEEMRHGEVGKFIAEWIYERWLQWKERNSPVEV